MKKALFNKSLEIFEKQVQGVEDWKQSGLGGDAQVVQMAPGALNGNIFHAFFENAAVSVCWFDQPLHHRGPVTTGAVTFTMCLNVLGHATQRGVDVKAGDVTIYKDNSERDTVHSGKFYRYFTLAVRREILEKFLNIYSPEQLHFLDATSIYQTPSGWALPGIRRLEEAAALLQAIGCESGKDFNSSAFALSILSCFLTMLPDKGTRKDCSFPGSDRRLVQEVAELMQSEEATALCVPTLCLSLGVSRRTLERAFQRTLDMSPAHYLTLFRLCRAREDLVSNSDTVSNVAMKHGFFELGRFSQRYKQLFGEFPSETRAANRILGQLMGKARERSLGDNFGRRLPKVA